MTWKLLHGAVQDRPRKVIHVVRVVDQLECQQSAAAVLRQDLEGEETDAQVMVLAEAVLIPRHPKPLDRQSGSSSGI